VSQRRGVTSQSGAPRRERSALATWWRSWSGRRPSRRTSGPPSACARPSSTFDITEINYAYRDFFARELRAGRFSRWFPGTLLRLPLYSESQAGLSPPAEIPALPWLPTWQAFNLDTVLSIWLTGLGTYGWLRPRQSRRGR